jgi:hypothetical protein
MDAAAETADIAEAAPLLTRAYRAPFALPGA